ncbi:MAG: TRAP transporter substrate-binding protein [Phycisphaerae bacterium]|nr:TRAP transporter substrate-binding protein [Phycisphaerae bacterium]
MTKAVFSTLAILCLWVGVVGCGKKEKVTVLKLAHGLNTEHPVHKAMVVMAEKVAEKSQGAMRVDIYPSEQLGSETKCLQQLQNGELAMTKTSSSPLESFVEEMKVLGLPYIFRDNDHYWKVLLGPVGKELLAAGTSQGLKGLCYYDAGARSFYTVKTPVSTPNDLSGLKIRVQKSPVAFDMVKAMGASATPIDWGELYTALQQGVVDGAENNAPSLYTSKHYEICKHYILDEHTMPPDVLLISPVIWKRLTAEEQTILQEAVDESVTYQRKLWAEFEQQSMDEIRKAGVQITDVDKAPFRAKVQAMLKAYDGTPIGDMIKRIDEVQ